MDDTMEDSKPDSPAVPGRADATVVLTISPAPSESHAPPQTQLGNSEAHASSEAADADVIGTRTVDRSIFDRLRECIPKRSNSVLESVIHDRTCFASAALRSDSDSIKTSFLGREVILEQIDKLKPSDHCYLVIDNIDDKWCDALCDRYPKAINERFLLEHIVGTDLRSCGWDCDPAGVELQRIAVGDLERLNRTFPEPKRPAAKILGQHIDNWLEPENPGPDIIAIEGYLLRSVPWGWAKINRFLSYCRLKDKLYLVLTTSLPDCQDRTQPHRLCMSLGFPARIQRNTSVSKFENSSHNGVKWDGIDMFQSTLGVIDKCLPFLSSRVPAEARGNPRHEMFAEGFVLTNLILAANVQASVEESETALRHIAYSTAEDDQGRFTRLIGFRRDVGSCYDDLKFMNTSVMDYMGLPHVFQYTTMVTNKDMIDKQRKEGLTRPICAHLDELEKKLDAVKEDLNEELQVTIGTVQVREAQLMREQTRITARQTTWTVALTVLAAVYLPMTLVTGIFGMNITEISSEASAPNAWWAVGTWVVVAGLTVAGILSYVAISKLRARKRKSDLEANDECQKSSDKGEADVGKWFSKTSKDWIGWLKQKAKMVWTPKQE